VTAQALLATAAVLAGAAWRSDRREERATRPRPSSLALLAALGRAPARVLPAAIVRGPDAGLADRARAGIAAADVPAARAGAIAAFAALAVAAFVSLGGIPGAVAGLALVGFGWAYPDAVLRSAAARRARRIDREAPALLDLVAAGVEAGLPLAAAVDGAAAVAGGELAEEVERSRRAIELGRPWHEEMRDLGARTGAPALAALGLAVRLSERLGVPLAAALRDQADRSRAEESRAVRERAARAGPRVLLVVVFVLVPAALLPVLAAAALTVADSFHF
jgi:Flp pilus assembly protein TadB